MIDTDDRPPPPVKAFKAPGGRSKIFDQFLAGYVQRRNRNLTFGSAISRIEVQQWRWNYAVDPNDPGFGWVADIYPFDIAAKALPPRECKAQPIT